MKTKIKINRDLIGLIPEFLNNISINIVELQKLVLGEDFSGIREIAYKIKGSGGSYGLYRISEAGSLIIDAADKGDIEAIKAQIEDLSEYLDGLEIIEEKLTVVCLGCGKSFEQKDVEKYCPQCIVAGQEKLIKEKLIVPVSKKKSRKKLLVTVMLLLLTLFIVVFIVQFPKILDASKTEKHIRRGTYDTDRIADRCIENLWKISKAMEENKQVDTSLVCPATNMPYRIELNKVFCPDPEKHKLKSLFIDRKNRVPEAIK